MLSVNGLTFTSPFAIEMKPENLRIGLGHDTHRLVDGGPLVIGGVQIPFEKQLDGHSDADVLLHAITDAVLGAAGLGDIGELFPNTDESNRGRDSADMLRVAMTRFRDANFKLLNVDCILFAERPRFSEYKQSMETSIASALDVEPRLVNVKAKTGESLGDVGASRCMQAQAVALAYREGQ